MERMINDADAVVCICSHEYIARFDEASGSGVAYEADLIRVARTRSPEKLIIPVVIDAPAETGLITEAGAAVERPLRIPAVLGAWHVRLQQGSLLRAEGSASTHLGRPIEPLVRALLRLPEHSPSPIGSLPELAQASLRSVGQVTADTAGWEVPPQHAEALVAYLDWVVEQYDVVESGRDATKDALSRVYVRPKERAIADPGEVELEDLVRRSPKGRWSLQGDPGSGKTTLLRHLAITISTDTTAALESGHALGPSAVPVLVPLPVWVAAKGRPEALAAQAFADDPVLGHRRGRHSAAAVAEALAVAADRGRVLYLLDGLDEVPPGAGKDTLFGWLHRLAEPQNGCAVILTTRRFGYTSPSKLFKDFEVLPFNEHQQQELLNRLLSPNLYLAARLESEIRRKPTMSALAGNPLMLSLMATLALDSPSARELLPTRRLGLYDAIVGRLLRNRRRGSDVDDNLIRAGLGAFAFTMLGAGGGTWSWPAKHVASVVAEIPELAGRLRGDPCQWLHDRTGLIDVPKHCASPRDAAASLSHSAKYVSFRHRSLLEFLAAEYLARAGITAVDRTAQEVSDGEAGLASWAEVFALYVGMATDPAQELNRLARLNHRLATRALPNVEGLTLKDLLGFLGGGGEPLALVRDVLERVNDRTACGNILARVASENDSADVAELCAAACFIIGCEEGLAEVRSLYGNRVAPYAWCELPEGEFTMGDPRNMWEAPTRKERVSGFSILNVPITRALYLLVMGGSHGYFTGKGRLPIETITWIEATDFCQRWAYLAGVQSAYTRRGHEVRWNPTALGPRLPTEAEWEYACRAGTSTSWWVGDDESALEAGAWYGGEYETHETKPVAIKAPNPWGLYDCHGNVREWCWDGFRAYGTPALRDDVVPRVLRGGGYLDTADRCRSAARDHYLQTSNGWQAGFRVAKTR